MADAMMAPPERWPANNPEQRAVKTLKPQARNARTHSRAQVEQIAASMREWGWTTPALIDEGDNIIAGHGRILAADVLGIETIPVIVARGWSDAQKRAYVIADNQLALNAGWDDGLLRVELGELQEIGFDVGLVGFDAAALDDLLNPPAPPAPGGSLAEKFGVPPFSVLRAAEGWWQNRKAAWLALGIQSELGRGANALDMSAQVAGITDPAEIEKWNEARRKGVGVGANTPHEGKGMAAGLIAVRAGQKARRKPNAAIGGGSPAAGPRKKEAD